MSQVSVTTSLPVPFAHEITTRKPKGANSTLTGRPAYIVDAIPFWCLSLCHTHRIFFES